MERFSSERLSRKTKGAFGESLSGGCPRPPHSLGGSHGSRRVGLEFFEDVMVPHDALPDHSTFDNKTNQWVWNYDYGEEEEEAGEERYQESDDDEEDNDEEDNDGKETSKDKADAANRFVFESGRPVRVRVIQVTYSDSVGDVAEALQESKTMEERSAAAAASSSASATGAEGIVKQEPGSSSSSSKTQTIKNEGAVTEDDDKGGKKAPAAVVDEEDDEEERSAPKKLVGGSDFAEVSAKMAAPSSAMTVLATMAEEGLGVTAWWDEAVPEW
jgi:hypothetical protein